jgi:hypothetical protein
VEAALWQPANRPVNATTLVITVHGSGGTFHGNPNGFLSNGLAARGYAVLGINTRQSAKRVNTDNFLEVRRDLEAAVYTAMQALREGKDDQVMPVQMFWIGGEKVPMSGRHFLTYRAENSSAADGTYWIRRVPYPILMVRDEGDSIIQPFEPYMLLSAATTPGSLVPAIKYVTLSNKARGPAEHTFATNREPLVEAVAAWLGERGLR